MTEPSYGPDVSTSAPPPEDPDEGTSAPPPEEEEGSDESSPIPRWRPLPARRQTVPPDPPPGAASVIAAVMQQRIIARGREPRRLAELYLDEHRMHGRPAIVRWAG